MTTETITSSLLHRLPAVRGRYTPQAPLAPSTWFRVGGAAEVLYRPADVEDLQHFLAQCPADILLTTMGVASNLLIRDGGLKGVVIRLGGGFAAMSADGTTLSLGAGALDSSAATLAQQAGIAGLEFLSGIPGTIGGALRMNAGCYGREIKDVFVEAEAVDRSGTLHRLTLADMGFSYRHCAIDESWIFTRATLRGVADAPEAIAARMKDIQEKREASQPLRTRTGGSTFANPEGAKAWELIDKAGYRGAMRGGAQISEKHCNFLINTGNATAADLEGLGEDVRAKVKAQSGFDLRWEIKRIGEP